MHKPDYILIALLGILIVFGLVMLSSASSAVAYEKFGDSLWYLKHQIIFGLLPGLVAFVVMSKIDYGKWKKYAFPMLLVSVGLLLLVFIPGLGASYGTAQNWINIFGISMQPSEIVKLTFLLYLAAWFAGRGRDLKNVSSGLLPFIGILGVIVLLMVLQPDIGTMAVIVLISLIVYFVAGASVLHLSWIGSLGAIFFFLLIKTAPYRAQRFMTFLHPELDPQGIGYHINQALLAIGSGGLFGLGFGHSRQKFQYLPEVAGDSIFAIIAEELGFIIVAGLVVLFIFLAIRGLKIAKNSPDNFGRLVATGIISWFVFQAFINIGAMIGLLPLTGIPLPFISYGGTAMATALAAAGILVNISKQAKT